MHNKTILPPRGGIGPTTPPLQLTGSGGGGDLAVMGDEERGMQHTRPEKQMMTAATERGTPAAADTRTRPRPPLVATSSSSRDISDKKRMYCTPRSPDGRGATAAELPPQLRGRTYPRITHREHKFQLHRKSVRLRRHLLSNAGEREHKTGPVLKSTALIVCRSAMRANCEIAAQVLPAQIVSFNASLL